MLTNKLAISGYRKISQLLAVELRIDGSSLSHNPQSKRGSRSSDHLVLKNFLYRTFIVRMKSDLMLSGVSVLAPDNLDQRKSRHKCIVGGKGVREYIRRNGNKTPHLGWRGPMAPKD